MIRLIPLILLESETVLWIHSLWTQTFSDICCILLFVALFFLVEVYATSDNLSRACDLYYDVIEDGIVPDAVVSSVGSDLALLRTEEVHWKYHV